MAKQTIKGIYFSTEKLTEKDKLAIRNAMKLAEKRNPSTRQNKVKENNNHGESIH